MLDYISVQQTAEKWGIPSVEYRSSVKKTGKRSDKFHASNYGY
jgi:hypothetical protein